MKENPLVVKVMEDLVNAGLKQKYEHYGVYCIKVDGIVVYIGKSRNMLRRVAEHMVDISYRTNKNMYNVLRQLQLTHHLSFDVMQRTKQGDDNEMGFAEAHLIHRYQPCLNIQYPDLLDYHKYRCVGQGKKITAEQVEKILDEKNQLT